MVLGRLQVVRLELPVSYHRVSEAFDSMDHFLFSKFLPLMAPLTVSSFPPSSHLSCPVSCSDFFPMFLFPRTFSMHIIWAVSFSYKLMTCGFCLHRRHFSWAPDLFFRVPTVYFYLIVSWCHPKAPFPEINSSSASHTCWGSSRISYLKKWQDHSPITRSDLSRALPAPFIQSDIASDQFSHLVSLQLNSLSSNSGISLV